jgi:hypothetical protein
MTILKKISLTLPITALLLTMASMPVKAQYLGDNWRGDVGLRSGSQAGPGYYLLFPLFYDQQYSSLRLSNGNKVPGDQSFSNKFIVPAVSVVTDFKILGGTWGFQVVPVIAKQQVDVAAAQHSVGNSYGFADMYFQPFNLGWHTKRADYLVAYGFYAPTGSGARTLDMWAHEIQGGVTLYLDEGRKWNVSTLLSYDISQTKRSTDVKVGDYLTLEGGFGRSFLKGGVANAGMSYVAQYKVTNDSGSGIPPVLVGAGRNTGYGLGPEVSMPFFAKGSLVGLITFRYTFEFRNATNFQGNDLLVQLTLAKIKHMP